MALGKTEQYMLAGLLFLLMLGLGATLTIGQVFNVLKHPKGIAVGWASQFGWMPLIATVLVMAFGWNKKPAAPTSIVTEAADFHRPLPNASLIATLWRISSICRFGSEPVELLGS